ncbi:unnamed protein product [Allacma fusca]|uniref:Uncharacterized protein n=1 Tax=Allacma fusca TaxID=39272 RepID=A0A8J2JZV4_9HEXA|nr:unnamed protein product [Allacma fusca]
MSDTMEHFNTCSFLQSCTNCISSGLQVIQVIVPTLLARVGKLWFYLYYWYQLQLWLLWRVSFTGNEIPDNNKCKSYRTTSKNL